MHWNFVFLLGHDVTIKLSKSTNGTGKFSDEFWPRNLSCTNFLMSVLSVRQLLLGKNKQTDFLLHEKILNYRHQHAEFVPIWWSCVKFSIDCTAWRYHTKIQHVFIPLVQYTNIHWWLYIAMTSNRKCNNSCRVCEPVYKTYEISEELRYLGVFCYS